MQTRRTFFGTAAAGVASVSAAATETAAARPADTPPPGPYDFRAIDARLALPFRHRQAFGADRIADGAAATYMLNTLNAYQFAICSR